MKPGLVRSRHAATTLRNQLRAGSFELARPTTALLQVNILRLLGLPLLRPID
jgi:hypothetical protein